MYWIYDNGKPVKQFDDRKTAVAYAEKRYNSWAGNSHVITVDYHGSRVCTFANLAFS